MNLTLDRAKSSWKAAALLSGLFLLGSSPAGCDGNGSDAAASRSGVFLVDLVLSGDPISVQVGSSAVVTATGRYSDNSFKAEEVAWSITPAAYATIDSTGMLTGVSPGLTHVQAVAVSDPSVIRTALVNVTTQPPPPVTIDPSKSTPTTATIGASYTYQLGALNGQSPFTWTLSAGALPAGIKLQTGTGTLSGVAAGPAGISSFTLRVTDSVGATNTKAVTLNVVVNVGGGT